MYKHYLQKALSNLIMARQALQSFQMIKQKDLKNGAAYHAQQAIELLVKYCIYTNKNYISANSVNGKVKEIFTHDIDMLIKSYYGKYKVNVPDKIKRNAKIYTTWEAESRYGLHFSVRIDSIQAALDEAENWLIRLKPLYKAQIANIRKKIDT